MVQIWDHQLILSVQLCSLQKSFVEYCSINSYKILSDSLDRVTPHGRFKGKILCAGSTIPADRCHLQMKPLHVKRKWNESMHTTFPRPYKKYIPGGIAHQIIFSDTYYNLFIRSQPNSNWICTPSLLPIQQKEQDIILYHPMQKKCAFGFENCRYFFYSFNITWERWTEGFRFWIYSILL